MPSQKWRGRAGERNPAGSTVLFPSTTSLSALVPWLVQLPDCFQCNCWRRSGLAQLRHWWSGRSVGGALFELGEESDSWAHGVLIVSPAGWCHSGREWQRRRVNRLCEVGWEGFFMCCWLGLGSSSVAVMAH